VTVRSSSASRGSQGARGRGRSARLASSRWGAGTRVLLCAVLLVLLVGGATFTYFYVRFSRVIDARLSGDVFNNASLIFAAPTPVFVGEAISEDAVTARLRKALYGEDAGESPVGSYRLIGNRLEIRPGPASFFTSDDDREGPVALQFARGHIVSISALSGTQPLQGYQLEPEVITTLFDDSRTKRRLERRRKITASLLTMA